jgi:SNF2 family DNA or RNA helicase
MLQSGALGLNLTCANRVIICDPWWNAAVEAQALGRVFRIGQQKETYIRRILVNDTIDTRIEKLQMMKLYDIQKLMSHRRGPFEDVENLAGLFGRVVTDGEGDVRVVPDYDVEEKNESEEESKSDSDVIEVDFD